MALFPERKPLTHRAAMQTFSDRVVQCALAIPPGRVSTYGLIARAAGGTPITARSITTILGKAWRSGEKDIPFHRIVYSDGRIWIDERLRTERMVYYRKEGIKIDEKNRVKNFQKVLYDFRSKS